MADKKNVVATDPGTGTKKNLQTKNQQAEEESRVLDCLEDDEVQEALDLLHERDERTAPSEG